MPLLEIRDVTKAYEGDGVVTRVLHGLSFSVEEGEFVSIMGPSGSGKSTLLHILGLLDRPTTGQYLFDGKVTQDMEDDTRAHLRNEDIGFVFQVFHLIPRVSVLENVMMPLYYSDIPPAQYRERAERALDQVGMTHRLDHTPSQLSGGERQRTAIARALVNEPRLILADEPTGNLDSKSGRMVMDMIDRLHKNGHTVLVITHETPTASYAQRMIKIRDGLIESDSLIESAHRHYEK